MIGILAVPLISACAFATTYSVLYDFTGEPDGGSSPCGELSYHDGYIYGMTYTGGTTNQGTVFRIDTGGTGFTILHSFLGGADDGATPWYTKLTHSGSDIYGMTYGGGTNYGVVFKLDTAGDGFTLLHTFAGEPADGAKPDFDLTLFEDTLYGITTGNSLNKGTIFSIDTTGDNYNILHKFLDAPNDGQWPAGYLTPLGGVLYGVTCYGGTSDMGTLFKIDTDGSNPDILYNFTGALGGQAPFGGLLVVNDLFYGTTYAGGANGDGTIYGINTDGTGIALLHEFDMDSGDGKYPYGHLTLAGDYFYGTTLEGGESGIGVVYRIGTDGTGYTLMHEFAGNPDDGSTAYAGLTLVDNTLYGMTYAGGENTLGVIFSLELDGGGEVPEPSTLLLLVPLLGGLWWMRRRRK